MARAVGNALHKNPDPLHIPCYRVVNSKGELAGEFAFGGAGKQAELLMADGIEVVNGRVDLKKYFFASFNSYKLPVLIMKRRFLISIRKRKSICKCFFPSRHIVIP